MRDILCRKIQVLAPIESEGPVQRRHVVLPSGGRAAPDGAWAARVCSRPLSSISCCKLDRLGQRRRSIRHIRGGSFFPRRNSRVRFLSEETQRNSRSPTALRGTVFSHTVSAIGSCKNHVARTYLVIHSRLGNEIFMILI